VRSATVSSQPLSQGNGNSATSWDVRFYSCTQSRKSNDLTSCAVKLSLQKFVCLLCPTRYMWYIVNVFGLFARTVTVHGPDNRCSIPARGVEFFPRHLCVLIRTATRTTSFYCAYRDAIFRGLRWSEQEADNHQMRPNLRMRRTMPPSALNVVPNTELNCLVNC
jgi:hypothetical protein